jgi:hemolysin D
MNNPFRKDDAHEFKPAIAEIEENPSSPVGGVTFWIIIAVIVFSGLWLCLGKVDVVVSARGSAIPVGDVKILQPLDTGVVGAILCREGDYVGKGQVLMEIDPSTTAPELESKRKLLAFTELERMRLSSVLEKKPFRPDPARYDRDLIRMQQAILAATVGSLEKQIETRRTELIKIGEEITAAEKERDLNRDLLASGADRKKRMEAVLDIIARDDYEKVVNDVRTYANAIEQLGHKLEQLRQRKNQIAGEIAFIDEDFCKTTLKEFSEKDKQVSELRAEIEKTSFRNAKQRILSPVDGHVATLFVHTIGGVVTPAQKLITVVPATTPLTIKATVLNRDIGFVKEGMAASIKVDAFDFQKYGLIDGTVKVVSRHSIEDERLGPVYEVYIHPSQSHLVVGGRKTPLSSGMSLTAEIRVGERRIIEFFIYPLIRYLDEGIKVR